MRTKIRAYRKTNFVLIRKFTDYLHRFFIVLKGGAMEEFTKELLDQLNVDTAFTIGPFAISESVVITWVVMAILVLLSAWLTRGLKVHNPGKKQIVAESIVIWLDKFTISMLGENAKEYSTYISTILLYIGLANIIGIFGMKPPTKDMNVTIALALMSIVLIEISGIRTKAMKKASGSLRINLAQYREMKEFTQFASDLDDATKRQLQHGQVLMELLKQPLNHPMSHADMVIILVVADAGILDDLM